jgi:hypothetical protein
MCIQICINSALCVACEGSLQNLHKMLPPRIPPRNAKWAGQSMSLYTNSHPGRFLGQHASDADSNGRRRMEAGRTIMLPNAMMQMPIQMWQYCIIQWQQHKAQVRRLRTRHDRIVSQSIFMIVNCSRLGIIGICCMRVHGSSFQTISLHTASIH